MIGIIGYGFVGKAVEFGFPNVDKIISDPAYNSVTLNDVLSKNPTCVFLCLPTPTNDTNYSLIKSVLNEIKDYGYKGLVVIKSTILYHHIEDYDVILNPEFLSRGTSNEDFINPPFVIMGGKSESLVKLKDIYEKYSIVDLKNVVMTDLKTASLVKYTFNTFFSTKVTFFNEIYEICEKVGVSYEEIKKIIKKNPWIANKHIDVPGHEGRGFSGPCLPKDTEALMNEYDVKLLKSVLDRNEEFRKK